MLILTKLSILFFLILEDPQLSLKVHMNPRKNRISACILCGIVVQQVYPTDLYVDGCWWICPDGRNISQNSKDLTIVYDRSTCKITLNRKNFNLTNCCIFTTIPICLQY